MNNHTPSILLLFLFLGIAWASGPPLSHLPESLRKVAEEELTSNSGKLIFNFGLTGAVTQEDWDRATVDDAEPPTILHPDLNGSPEPVLITGKVMRTIKNRDIYSFQGIRYANPPTGERRFKKPEPADPFWTNDTLDATHLGEKCPQRALFGPVAAGSEDCLSLNVYTPYLPDEDPPKEPLPVMMFIHGGAFISGDSSLYMPTRLLDHDVILVTIHYRLGSLGFFSLQNDDAPGNAGLWDQIEAMKWIQNYIYGFGGDPNRVTIFGESAGSASVNFHMVLPASKGLFHGVIGESGSALEHWALDPEPLISAALIAGRNGCPNETEWEIYDCMKDMSHETLSLNMHDFVNEDRGRGEMGFRGAAPVLDGFNLTDPLVTKYPEQYYEDGEASDVPLLIGCNKHEGSFVMGIMYSAFLIPHVYVNDSYYLKNGLMSDLLNAFGVRDQTNGIGESIVDAYMGGVDMMDFNEDIPGLIDTASVFFLKAGGWMTAKMHAKHTNASTYFYSFDYESDDSMFYWLFIGAEKLPYDPGVTHADELMYLFSLPAYLEGHQLVVKDRLVALWTNFAIHGDPTPDADKDSWQSLNIPKWNSLTDDKHPYMLIQEECTLEEEYPNRWHITVDEAGISTTTSPSSTTTSNPVPGDYDQVKQERQAFMISMIVFIVSSVVLGGASVFFFFKSRR